MNRLMRPVTRSVFNLLLPRAGQRHDRIIDILDIWIRGWEEGKLAVEIGEEIWQNIKSQSPVLKDRAAFFLKALAAGWGAGDVLVWYLQTGGRWTDEPSEVGPAILGTDPFPALASGSPVRKIGAERAKAGGSTGEVAPQEED